MGLHLYCIVPAGHAPAAGLEGVSAGRVETAEAGEVAFWYSQHAERPAVDAAAVLAHHAVIEAAMTESVTPVPVRFGQWFETVDAACDRIGADAARWRSTVDRFTGCAEFGVHVSSDAFADPARDVHRPDGTGTDYMAALARRHADAERRRAEAATVSTQLDSALAGITEAAHIEQLDAGGLVRCAYLVAKRRAADYHAVLAQVRRSRSDLRFVFTGPWPPYSFVA